MSVRKSALVATTIITLSLVFQVVQAQQIAAEFRAGAGTTDNVARTPIQQIEEDLLTGGLSFSALHNTGRLNLDIQSQFDYVHYQDGTFPSEWIGGFSGLLDYAILPERLTWVIEENYGQTFNPLIAETPSTREDVNFFTTGPTFTINPASRNRIDLEARYSTIDYSRRNDDNERVSGAVRFLRDIRPGHILSINVEADNVQFEDPGLTPEFDRSSVFVGYQGTGVRNELNIQLGYNEVETIGETGDGLLATVDWTYRPTPNGEVTVLAGHLYSDQGNIFRLSQTETPTIGDAIGSLVIDDPFINTYGGIRYSLQTDRNLFDIGVGLSDEDYEELSQFDRKVTSADVLFRRDLSRRLFIGARYGQSRQEFSNVPDSDTDDIVLGVELGFRFTQTFSVSVLVQQYERETALDNTGFEENRSYLQFTYVPAWSQRGRLRRLER